jgi:selenide,water dikinase
MSVVESANATTTFAGLRALAGCGGCAAKAPRDLVAMLGQVAAAAGVGAEVLVGLTPYDDAAVYALDSERALIATVDFFPPLVDDPDDFGAIAAANAVSDIYAMGGSVAFALAVSGFPAAVPADVIARVAGAAAAVVRQCGGSVLGGHSIRCAEAVFGLCVLGFVHPGRIWRKHGARAGDVLMLSKPLGTGLLVSANNPGPLAAAVASMKTTNRAAAAALQSLARAPHAVTDVSGFGLAGHLEEMITQSGVSARLDAERVPLLAGALAAAQAGVRTSAHRQPLAPGSALEFAGSVSRELQALVTDPQTSGGLLVAVDAEDVATLTSAGFAAIGTVSAGPPRLLVC